MTSPHHTFGFITIESSTSYTNQLLLGANDAATQLGCSLVTFGINEQTMQAKVGTAQFYEKLGKLVDLDELDGLMLWTAGLMQDHDRASELLRPYTTRPTVSLGVDLPGAYSVVMDGYQGMFDLVSHLIAICNRRKLAFITGTPTNRDAQIRLAAYQDALRHYGLPIVEEAIVPAAFRWDSRALGARAVCELLDRRHFNPDAIVAASDDLAIGALQELQRRGIAVPETISVTGFDDLPEAALLHPGLTTVAQSAYTLAGRGITLLMAILKGEAISGCVKIPTQPVIRESCGMTYRSDLRQGHLGSFFMPIPTATAEQGNNDKVVNTPREDRLPLQPYLVAMRGRYRQIIEGPLAAQMGEKSVEERTSTATALLESFEQSLLSAEPYPLQKSVEQLLQRTKQQDLLAGWQQGLLALLQQFDNDCTMALSPKWGLSLQPEQQALLPCFCRLLAAQIQYLFEEATNRAARHQYVVEKQQFALLHMVSRSLLIPYDPQRLAEIFQEKLPQLGIDLAYVAIHEAFDATTAQARLLVAYEACAPDQPLMIDQLYRADELASGSLIRQGRQLNLILIPLYSTNIYAGFALFGFRPRSYQFYTQLASMLGYSLVSSILYDEMRVYADQLEEHVSARTEDIQRANQQLQIEIAERRRIEGELEKAYQQALESSRLKSEFLATMSHEIRTPMNGIMGMTEILMESGLDAEQVSYATVAYEESQKLLSIINSILDFSKIEAGKIILESVPFVPAEELESVIRLLTPKAHSRGIGLLSTIVAGVPTEVIGDSTRLRQILMNLVGNALKFTETGEVAVTLNCLAHPVDPPTTTDESLPEWLIALQLTIRDTGIGMSAESMGNLFQVFMQADSSTTRRYGGTGLGLAITQRLVDLLGGHIEVESQLGVGSKFTVTLPYRCSEAVYRAALVSTATPSIGTSLVVTNDYHLYQEVEAYLATWQIATKQYGHQTGGNAGLLAYLRQAMSTGKPLQYLLVDQQSVELEPFTLVRSMRADPLLAKLVIILITQQGLPSSQKEQLLVAGFDGVTTLPITQSAIYNSLTPFLQQPASTGCSANGSAPAMEADAHPLADSKPEPLVLVVEDYVNNQRVALAHLKKLGYAAHIVDNGEAAVNAIVNSGDLYRLVLMDWQMPVMDGLEATRKIREWERDRGGHLPIIGMTANAIKGSRESCLDAGMDDYLSKPVRREELQALLTAWMPVA